MPDKILHCIGTREEGCGKEFVFTEAEQKFFAEKEFTEPKRCKDCRAKVKAFRASGQGSRR